MDNSTQVVDGEITPSTSPNSLSEHTTLSSFFDDIIMTTPSCRKDKEECDSCSG